MKKITFEEATVFVHSLGLKSKKEWVEYCKSGNKPDSIPSDPYKYYKNEWVSWGDWLGTYRVSNKDKKFISFDEAKILIKKLNIKSKKDYENFQLEMIEKLQNNPIKTAPEGSGKTTPQVFGRINRNVPTNPNVVYNSFWNGWNDFLGIEPQYFLSFEEARKYVRTLNLKSVREWEEYRKQKPDNIPSLPKNIYNTEWIGWGDWLGTNNIATKYISFDEFQKFINDKFKGVASYNLRIVYEKW